MARRREAENPDKPRRGKTETPRHRDAKTQDAVPLRCQTSRRRDAEMPRRMDHTLRCRALGC
eukprot:4198211-Prorocentrum_lima.AAC.1